MSTTVTYKGNTIATLTNQTKSLATAGKWMEADVVITDSGSGGGSAITIVDTLDENGGTIREVTSVSLSGDTVTPEVLQAGYTAHNALGQPIVGTASPGGPAIPTFTVMWDDDYTEIQSLTCNMTFAECAAYYSSGDNGAGFCVERTEPATQEYVYPINVVDVQSGQNPQITFACIYDAVPVFDIIYSGNNTATIVYQSSKAHTLNVVANGTYEPLDGVYTSVEVNVPDSTLLVGILWDDVNEQFVPDKTYAEIYAAYSAGTDIAVYTPDVQSAQYAAHGYYDPIGAFFYDVYSIDNTTGHLQEDLYRLLVSETITRLSHYVYYSADSVVTYYTGSSAPSSSLGQDGDIYLQTGA